MATKLRIQNSFICPYLHIFFLLLPLLFGVVKSALRLAFGWLSLPIFRLPFPSLPVPSSAPLRLRIQRSGRGRALPRHSSNSSHVIVENETNFCNLIAFRVDAGSERGGRQQGRACALPNNLPMYSPVACVSRSASACLLAQMKWLRHDSDSGFRIWDAAFTFNMHAYKRGERKAEACPVRRCPSSRCDLRFCDFSFPFSFLPLPFPFARVMNYAAYAKFFIFFTCLKIKWGR